MPAMSTNMSLIFLSCPAASSRRTPSRGGVVLRRWNAVPLAVRAGDRRLSESLPRRRRSLTMDLLASMMVINTPCCSNQTLSQPKNSEPIPLALKSSHRNLLNTQVRHNFPHVASDCASLRFGRIRSTDSHPSRRIRPTDWHPASPVTLHPSGPPSVEPPRRCLVRRTPSSALRPSNAFVGASSVEPPRRCLVRRTPSSAPRPSNAFVGASSVERLRLRAGPSSPVGGHPTAPTCPSVRRPSPSSVRPPRPLPVPPSSDGPSSTGARPAYTPVVVSTHSLHAQ